MKTTNKKWKTVLYSNTLLGGDDWRVTTNGIICNVQVKRAYNKTYATEATVLYSELLEYIDETGINAPCVDDPHYIFRIYAANEYGFRKKWLEDAILGSPNFGNEQ